MWRADFEFVSYTFVNFNILYFVVLIYGPHYENTTIDSVNIMHEDKF